MTKEQIITETQHQFAMLTSSCEPMHENDFFNKPGSKWSVAEQVKHLMISTNASALAFWLPKFLVRWIGGKPNRSSRTYEELAKKYYLKLEQGAVATARFVPKSGKDLTKKESLLNQWNKVSAHYLASLKKNRTEEDLDNYIIKHPLLGKITLRELCYFTIFHTQHHLNSIATVSSTLP